MLLLNLLYDSIQFNYLFLQEFHRLFLRYFIKKLKVHWHENLSYYDFYIIQFILFISLPRSLPFVSMLFH